MINFAQFTIAATFIAATITVQGAPLPPSTSYITTTTTTAATGLNSVQQLLDADKLLELGIMTAEQQLATSMTASADRMRRQLDPNTYPGDVQLTPEMLAIQQLLSSHQRERRGFWDDVGDAFENAADTVGNGLEDAAEDVGTGISTGMQDVQDGLEYPFDKLGNALGLSQEQVQNAIAQAINRRSFWDDISDVADDIGNGVDDAVNTVGNAVTDTASDVGNAVADTATNVASGLYNAANWAENEWQQLPQSTRDQIMNTINSINIGDDEEEEERRR